MASNKRARSDEYRQRLRRNMTSYGLAASLVGLPVGLWLNLPYVWGLSLLGIAVGGAKVWLWAR